MLAPAGAPTRLKLRVCTGMSWSVAVAVKVKQRLFSDRSDSPIGSSTGATLTSLTVTVIALHRTETVLLLSQTLTVKG